MATKDIDHHLEAAMDRLAAIIGELKACGLLGNTKDSS